MKQKFLKHLWLKLAIATVYALTLFSVASLVIAETRAQMQQRVVREYIDKYQLDVNCDAECVAVRESENPWLLPLAEQLEMDHSTLTRASIGHGIDWGFSFEETKAANTDCRAKSTPEDNKCAPTIHDWISNWTAINAQFQRKVDATPPLYKVDDWDKEGDARRFVYNGAYE